MKKQDYKELTKGINEEWKNFPVEFINNHAVRISVLQRDFHWHKHTKSDEFFFVIEGKLFVDFETHSEELAPGQMIKVPKDVMHRTRSNMRTILLCFETADNDVSGE